MKLREEAIAQSKIRPEAYLLNEQLIQKGWFIKAGRIEKDLEVSGDHASPRQGACIKPKSITIVPTRIEVVWVSRGGCNLRNIRVWV